MISSEYQLVADQAFRKTSSLQWKHKLGYIWYNGYDGWDGAVDWKKKGKQNEKAFNLLLATTETILEWKEFKIVLEINYEEEKWGRTLK